MKKTKRVLLSLASLLFLANNSFATTTGKYMAASENTDFGKLILLLIAIGLIAIVLFFGYKIDQSGTQEKRKEQIVRKNKNKVEDSDLDVYDNIEENNYSKEVEEEYEKEYKKLSEETAVMNTLYSTMEEKPVERIVEVKETSVLKETYKTKDTIKEKSSESTMVIDTSTIKDMIDEEE